MGVNPSRAKGLVDTDASVVLRDIADGAETATAIEASVSLKELDLAYWHDGNEIPHGVFEVHVHVSAAAVDGADEAYTFDLIVDDVSAMNNNPRIVASLPFAAAVIRPGVYRMFVASDQIKAIDPDTDGTDKFLAIRCTHAGASSSVTYGAWIGRTRHA